MGADDTRGRRIAHTAAEAIAEAQRRGVKLASSEIEELAALGRRALNERHCPICDGLGRDCICPLEGTPGRESNG